MVPRTSGRSVVISHFFLKQHHTCEIFETQSRDPVLSNESLEITFEDSFYGCRVVETWFWPLALASFNSVRRTLFCTETSWRCQREVLKADSSRDILSVIWAQKPKASCSSSRTRRTTERTVPGISPSRSRKTTQREILWLHSLFLSRQQSLRGGIRTKEEEPWITIIFG